MSKLLNGTAYVGTKVASKLALPSAICSTIHEGSVDERMYGGLKTTVTALYGVGKAYWDNSAVQVRDAINGAALDVMQAMGNAAGNIADDPETTAYAALGAFAMLKAPDMLRAGVNKARVAKDRRKLRKLERSLEDEAKREERVLTSIGGN